ncbi:hypothetical protein [Cryobacterium psychrophilum]|uniref:Uncharacterized protein n=1 Tax=Cryobacterium psychrophilum TaxID=41988 RepID=A0A4Y8KSI1_9MICO|nr:hypothetical protein [Cryobacterium psychrophilum]TDW28866.1 hypothetical protein EDD25_0519 [Cryobacterium psychrophilum]TFD81059.1 hypothetical protein E3T53_03505 [Cryobacterium psychrophilum]
MALHSRELIRGARDRLREAAFFLLLLALLSFVDRSPHRWWRHHPVAMTIGAIVALALIALTILMLVMPAQQHV